MVPDAQVRITVTVTAPALVANREGVRPRAPKRNSTSRAATRAFALARRRSNLRRRRAWVALQVLPRVSGNGDSLKCSRVWARLSLVLGTDIDRRAPSAPPRLARAQRHATTARICGALAPSRRTATVTGAPGMLESMDSLRFQGRWSITIVG